MDGSMERSGSWLSVLLLLFALWNNVFTQGLLNYYDNRLITFVCPASQDWLQIESKCYNLIYNRTYSWTEAKQYCIKTGGYLAAVNQTYVLQELSMDFGNHSLACEVEPCYFWLAYNVEWDSSTLSTLVDGSTDIPIYSPLWAEGQPRNVSSELVVVAANLNYSDVAEYGWHVFDGQQNQFPFICQYFACLPDQFRCHNNQNCINRNWICDGIDDCKDASDELNCTLDCGFDTANATEGVIESPGFQTNYPNNADCLWHISVQPQERIILTFHYFVTEQYHDIVEIRDSEDWLTAEHGEVFSGQLTNQSYRSASNSVFLHFTSDATITRRGFHIRFQVNHSIPDCTQRLQSSTKPKNLTTPYYDKQKNGQYPLNLECEWNISSISGSVISLQFEDFNLANDSYVKVFDGVDHSFPILGEYNQSNKPQVLISSGSMISIHFRSGQYRAHGFRLLYKTGCEDMTINASSGLVSSPGYAPLSNQFRRSIPVACSWNLLNSENGPITYLFSLFKLDTLDSLVFRPSKNSTVILANFTSSSPNITSARVRNLNGTLFLAYVTKSPSINKGFVGTYSKDCSPILPLPLNSIVHPSINQTSYGSTIWYSCFEGYELRPKSFTNRTCLLNGTWSNSEKLTCQPVFCGPPPDIESGWIQSIGGVTFGSIVSYSCYYGFAFTDNINVSVCNASAEWSTHPVCSSVECHSPPVVPHANFSSITGLKLNDRVNYKCDAGYDPFGMAFSICSLNGKWWTKGFQCKPKTCLPPIFDRGYLEPNTTFPVGYNATVYCETGYKPDIAIIVCERGGTPGKWSATPKCEDINECQVDPSICESHCGQCKCKNLIGSYLCLCLDGYRMDPSKGVCNDINECEELLSNCYGSGEDYCINIQPGYRCMCPPGMKLYTEELRKLIGSSPNMLINHTCVPSQCTPPFSFPQGHVWTNNSKYSIGTVVRYYCPPGAQAVPGGGQFAEARCQLNETLASWSLKEVPRCKPRYCPPVKKPQNGKILLLYDPGSNRTGTLIPLLNLSLFSVVRYECLPGFYLHGVAERICYQNKEGLDWTASSPICKRVECHGMPDPSKFKGGVYQPPHSNFYYGDVVYFICEPAYRLVGPSSLVCDAGARWSGQIPVCVPQFCDLPPLNEFVEAFPPLIRKFSVGSAVAFSCMKSGFSLEGGSSSIVCSLQNVPTNGVGNDANADSNVELSQRGDAEELSLDCFIFDTPSECAILFGRNTTGLPNLLGHGSVVEASSYFRAFETIRTITTECDFLLTKLLCGMLFPPCLRPIRFICRTFCQRVRDKCEVIIGQVGIKWPEVLICEKDNGVFRAENCDRFGDEHEETSIYTSAMDTELTQSEPQVTSSPKFNFWPTFTQQERFGVKKVNRRELTSLPLTTAAPSVCETAAIGFITTDSYVIRGDRIELTCSLQQQDCEGIQIMWDMVPTSFRIANPNDSPTRSLIQFNNRISLIHSGTTSHSLLIRDAQLVDSGYYFCNVWRNRTLLEHANLFLLVQVNDSVKSNVVEPNLLPPVKQSLLDSNFAGSLGWTSYPDAFGVQWEKRALTDAPKSPLFQICSHNNENEDPEGLEDLITNGYEGTTDFLHDYDKNNKDDSVTPISRDPGNPGDQGKPIDNNLKSMEKVFKGVIYQKAAKPMNLESDGELFETNSTGVVYSSKVTGSILLSALLTSNFTPIHLEISFTRQDECGSLVTLRDRCTQLAFRVSMLGTPEFTDWDNADLTQLVDVGLVGSALDESAEMWSEGKKTLTFSTIFTPSSPSFQLVIESLGACVSIQHVLLFYMSCPEFSYGMATFPDTKAPSSVDYHALQVSGTCVKNGIPTYNPPVAECRSNGRWVAAPRNTCVCKKGYMRLYSECVQKGPLCHACNSSSVVACARDQISVQCDPDQYCFSHVSAATGRITKGCQPKRSCNPDIRDYDGCRYGNNTCRICCDRDYCNFAPYAPVRLGWNGTMPVCRDHSPPVFLNCSRQPVLVPMWLGDRSDPFQVPLPLAEDNSDSYQLFIEPSDANATIVYKHNTFVNVTVVDYAGWTSSCMFWVNVSDFEPLVLNCPVELIREIHSVDSATRKVRATFQNVTLSGGAQKLTTRMFFDPPQGSEVDLLKPIVVKVIAIADNGANATCKFRYIALPLGCPRWALSHDTDLCFIDKSANNTSGAFCKVRTCPAGTTMVPRNAPTKYTCGGKAEWKAVLTIPGGEDEVVLNQSISWTPVCADTKLSNFNFYLKATIQLSSSNQACITGYAEQLARIGRQQVNVACASKVSYNLTSGNFTWSNQHNSSSIIIDAEGTIYTYIISIPYVISSTNPTAEFRTLRTCFRLVQRSIARIQTVGIRYDLGSKMTSLSMAPEDCPEQVIVTGASVVQTFSNPCGRGEVKGPREGECTVCPSGTFANSLGTICDLCPPGRFQAEPGSIICTLCPKYTWTTGYGAKSLDHCIDQCRPGYFSGTGSEPCIPCPLYMYQTEYNQTGCIRCPPSMATEKTASVAVSDCRVPCSPGSLSQSGLEPCKPCPQGFFNVYKQNNKCQPCPAGKTTRRVGAVSPSECVDYLPCQPNLCQNNSPCRAGMKEDLCLCQAGFYGPLCQYRHDPCSLYSCESHGFCVLNASKMPECQCFHGYQGMHCEHFADPCSAVVCVHGRPIPINNTACLCQCYDGFTGPMCTVQQDYCYEQSHPCHGGTCFGTPYGPACDCSGSHETGQFCDESLDVCSFGPCIDLTAENCTNIIGANFMCDCIDGYAGKFCQYSENKCGGNVCENNGTCYQSATGLNECLCPSQYAGTRCEIKKSACNTQPCTKGGACKDENDHHKCICSKGFIGLDCGIQFNNCSSFPCQNGGSCDYTVDDYVCICTDSWTGRNCEIPKMHCTNDTSCFNDGKCLEEWQTCPDEEATVGPEEAQKEYSLPEPCGYSCECARNYTGYRCEIPVDPCESNPCFDGSTCQFNGTAGEFACLCPPGWFGSQCDRVANMCLSSPCSENATCISLIDEYLCRCPEKYTGPECSERLSDCHPFLCLNGGTCSDSESGYKCSCNEGYSGEHCEVVGDPCAGSHACEHNGTCIPTKGYHYECHCNVGYTGTHCETKIDACKDHEYFCKNSGTCRTRRDGTPFCICPILFIGLHCDKERDENYNLHFWPWKSTMTSTGEYDESSIRKESSILSPDSLIHSTTYEQSILTFSLCGWVKYDAPQLGDEESVYITLAEYRGGYNKADAVVQFTSRYVKFLQPMLPDKTVPIAVNESLWHHLCFLYRTQDGAYRVYVDGVSKTNGSLRYADQRIESLPTKLQILLGGPVRGEPGLFFNGSLSLVMLYADELQEDMIRQMALNCSQWIIDGMEMPGIAIRWTEFERPQDGGRVVEDFPSICTKGICQPGSSSCKQDKFPPEVQFCPSDIKIASNDRLSTANWSEPVFTDNINVNSLYQNHRSGSVFSWGEYPIIYVAMDDANNTAVCEFKLYVTPLNCTPPSPPKNGLKICFNEASGFTCRIQCQAGMGFANPKSVSPFYSCGVEGYWDLRSPNIPFEFPPCSKVVDKPSVNVTGALIYNINCEDEKAISALLDEFRQSLRKLNLCDKVCDFNQMNVECDGNARNIPEDPPPNQQRRRRLAAKVSEAIAPTTVNKQMGIKIDFGLSVNYTNSSADWIAHAISKSTFAKNATSKDLMSGFVCPAGSELLPDGSCIVCPVGRYYDNSTQKCYFCPANTFQDLEGQFTCEDCPENRITVISGAEKISDCIERCIVGEFYSFKTRECVPCGLGLFQDFSGATACYTCNPGMTTRYLGATGEDMCEYQCNIGEEVSESNQCQPCPRGTFKERIEDSNCYTCPWSFSTPDVGSIYKENCTVLECPPGKYYDPSDNKCHTCPRGQYQDQVNQLSCKLCPADTATLFPGSTSNKSCLIRGLVNPCQEWNPCAANASCTNLPDGNTRCSCFPGFTGNGKISCHSLCEGYCYHGGNCTIDKSTEQPNCDCPKGHPGLQCDAEPVEGARMKSLIIGGVSGSVVFIVLVTTLIIVFKVKIYNLISCCKSPSLKDISTDQYYRNNTNFATITDFFSSPASTRDAQADPPSIPEPVQHLDDKFVLPNPELGRIPSIYGNLRQTPLEMEDNDQHSLSVNSGGSGSPNLSHDSPILKKSHSYRYDNPTFDSGSEKGSPISPLRFPSFKNLPPPRTNGSTQQDDDDIADFFG